MNIARAWFASDRGAPDIMKFVSIIILGVGLGIALTVYSPLIPLLGAVVFTTFSITLYLHSQYRERTNTIEHTAIRTAAESRHTFLFALFYLAFFISATIPKSGRTIATIPVTTANILILFTLGCWLIAYIVSEKTDFAIPLLTPMFFFMVYGIASFFIGIMNNNPPKYVILDFVAFIGFIPIYFLVCSVFRTKEQLPKVIWVVVLSLFLVCGYGVLQNRLGFERIAVPGITEQYGKTMYQGVGRWNVIEGGAQKVYSTFQNGNIFGNHLAMFIPFLGGILISLASSWKKMVLAGVFLLSCYVLILTYSRGALVGAIGGIITFALISKKIRLNAILVVLLICAVFAVFLYYSADRPELVRYDIRRMTSDPNTFSAGRVERAQQVLQGYANFPLVAQFFGIGFGGTLISPLGWRFEYVDNLYLTFLFKTGIVGLTMLLGVLGLLFRELLTLRARTADVYFRGLITGGISGLIGSLVHNLADTLWFFPPLSANFWFLAGITMAIALIGSQQSAPEKSVVIAPQKRRETPRSRT